MLVSLHGGTSCKLTWTITFSFFICSPVYHSKIIVPLCGHLENKDFFFFKFLKISSVQLLSRVRLFATPRTVARHASLSITNSRSLLKLMSIESVMPFNHLILCHPLLLLPLIFPSIRVFSNESVLPTRCPKYWSLSFSISPYKEYAGMISVRMDWLDLDAVQGTLKSLLQHHSSKALILLCSVFFIVQLSISICDHWKNHSFDPLLQIFKID